MHLRVFGLAQLLEGAKTAHFGFACTAWVGCPEPQRGTTRAVAHRGPCAQLRTKVKHQLRAQLRAPGVDRPISWYRRGGASSEIPFSTLKSEVGPYPCVTWTREVRQRANGHALPLMGPRRCVSRHCESIHGGGKAHLGPLNPLRRTTGGSFLASAQGALEFGVGAIWITGYVAVR